MMKNKRVEDDTPFLPEGILRDILIRLPVKSLIRFQCVCRDWRNLFKTPSFIADHLCHSNRQNPYILFQRGQLLYGNHSDFYSLSSDMQEWSFQNSPLLDHLIRRKIVSVSNGLLCLLTHRLHCSFLLWNPAIEEVKLVPETDVGMDFYYYCSYYTGFGFCPSLNDYKIVTFVDRYFEKFKVYSLRSNSWKEVKYRLDAHNICYKVTVNGVMFWWGKKKIRKDNGEYQCEELIFSFDLATEVWTVIPMPEHHSSTIYQNLMVYDGKLAFVVCTKDCEHSAIHLWVREEGVGASRETWNWTKKFTSNPYPSSGLFPETMCGNEIFCKIWDSKSTNTVLFNPTTEKFKNLNISKCDYMHQIFNYVESLESVGGTKSLTKFLKRQSSSSRAHLVECGQ